MHVRYWVQYGAERTVDAFKENVEEPIPSPLAVNIQLVESLHLFFGSLVKFIPVIAQLILEGLFDGDKRRLR